MENINLLICNQNESFSEEAIRNGYNIALLRDICWRLYQDLIWPTFSKNHKVSKLMLRLHEILGLRSSLDDICCGKFRMNVHNVAGYGMGCKITGVFYGHLIETECYNPNHGRERPLPNQFSYEGEKQIFELWKAYVIVLNSIKEYSRHGKSLEHYASNRPGESMLSGKQQARLQEHINTLEKDVGELHEICKRVEWMERLIEIDERWTDPNELRDFSLEELEAMVNGHPSNISS